MKTQPTQIKNTLIVLKNNLIKNKDKSLKSFIINRTDENRSQGK